MRKAPYHFSFKMRPGCQSKHICRSPLCSLAYLTGQKLSLMFTLELRNPPQGERPATVILREYFRDNVLDKIKNVNSWP